MEARKRAVEPQQLHTSNKQPRVVESAPACKSIWSVFDDDDEQLLPGSFPLLPHLPLRDEFAAFLEVCAERAQLGEQEKAVEDARAAAFDNDVGRNEWAPQFRRKPKPAKVDGEIFCAPKKDGSDGRRYEPAAADTAAAETAAEAEIKCKGASPLTAKEAVAAAEAQGLELVKSSRSATGFYGVAKTHRGTFYPQISEAGKKRSLGTYKTAEEAALIRAQHIGPEQAAALQERAMSALEKERVVALEKPVRTAKEAIAAAEAQGLELVKSSRSATGFYGVVEKRSGTFEVQIMEAGKKRCLGTYKTAEGAALIRAQHTGHEQGAAQHTGHEQGAAGARAGEPQRRPQRPLTLGEVTSMHSQRTVVYNPAAIRASIAGYDCHMTQRPPTFDDEHLNPDARLADFLCSTAAKHIGEALKGYEQASTLDEEKLHRLITEFSANLKDSLSTLLAAAFGGPPMPAEEAEEAAEEAAGL